MRRTGAFTLVAAFQLALALGAGNLRADEPPGKFEIHDVSLWILEPGSQQANLRTAYPSALPATVNSARSGQPATATTTARHVIPVNLITFYGTPTDNLDVDLRTKAGSFLAHWPPSEGLPNRLRWSGMPAMNLVEKIEDESELAFVDSDHWFSKAREGDALFIRRGARSERFLAYDVELNLPAPVKLEGGPDKYTAINTSGTTLHDVMISRATPEGHRVAWIDVLPPAKPVVAPKPPAAARPGDVVIGTTVQGKPVAVPSDIFDEEAKSAQPDKSKDKAEKPATKDDKPSQKQAAPAKAPAKVSPKLFGGIGVKPPDAKPADEKPKDAPKESPEKKETPAGKDPPPQKKEETKTVDKPADAPQAAGDAAFRAKMIRQGYIVPKAGGTPGEPVPAGAATPTGPGSGVEVTLSAPLAAGSDEAAAATTRELSERLKRAGLKPHEVELFLHNNNALFFEGDAIVVACRLAPGTIDDKIPLSVFPEPAKMVRVAMVLMRNADPQLGNEVERLIAQLGDQKYAAREAAQKRLLELGPLAFASLNKALTGTDLEIVIRAERILLHQGQTPNPQAKPAQAAPAGAAAPVAVPVAPVAVPVKR
jgi:hypothetical protein